MFLVGEEVVLLESILVSGLPTDLPPRVDSGRLFSVQPRRQVTLDLNDASLNSGHSPLDRGHTPGEEVAFRWRNHCGHGCH